MSYSKAENFEEYFQQIAALAKALSHPARVAILQHLARCSTCYSGEIADLLPLSRTTASQHLQELKKNGFLVGEVEGVKVCYCLNKKQVENALTLLQTFLKDIHSSLINCNNIQDENCG
jgi:DNA-binding transcriptional ArsR family regulator